MKKFLIQVFLLILVISGALFLYGSGTDPSNLSIPFLPQPVKLKDLQINNTILKVDIANTQSKRSKGLGDKESMAENEGMLFVFDRLDRHTFWMKGLKFPLDFVWIKDETVVEFMENIPVPEKNQPDSELSRYAPTALVNKVLELNAGSVKKFNIKVGDTIKLIN